MWALVFLEGAVWACHSFIGIFHNMSAKGCMSIQDAWSRFGIEGSSVARAQALRAFLFRREKKAVMAVQAAIAMSYPHVNIQ